MKHTLYLPALLAALSLSACDKPTVVNVPATPVAVPGPAGPTGATGSAGATGSQGASGPAGDGTTVIIVPSVAASAPTN